SGGELVSGFIEQFFFFAVNPRSISSCNIILRCVDLIRIEQQQRHINSCVRIVQLVWWQSLYNRQSFCASAEAIERERVSYGAIGFVWRTVVGLFGELMRAFNILFEVESEPGEIGCDRRLIWRAFVQPLQDAIEFFEIIIYSIESPLRVQRFRCDQFLTFAYASATATETGGEVSFCGGNLSTHLAASPASPFSFIQFMSEVRSVELRAANGFTLSRRGRNFF